MSNEPQPIEVQALSLTKVFGEGIHAIELFRGLDLIIRRGERLAIVGASGVGKSTLLHILGTLEKPSSGRVLYGGQDIFLWDEKPLAQFRNRQIGFVFQFHYLLPEFNALENVMMPGIIAGLPHRELKAQALALLERLELSNRLRHRVGELSGGEQQRVAVARALFNNPSVVLADEPSGNLDSAHAKELHQLFFDLRKELGQTFVIVTHNEELAGMADRRLVMKDGVI